MANVKDELFKLAQRFRTLMDEQKDFDFRMSTWARDARGAFSNDKAFTQWCGSDLGLTETQSSELLFRGRAAEIVPDVKAWRKLGGLAQIRGVEGLSKKDQVTALEAAKATGRSVRAIVRERHPATDVVLPSRILLSRKEAESLVKHFGGLGTVPRHIQVLINKIKLSLWPHAAESKKAA